MRTITLSVFLIAAVFVFCGSMTYADIEITSPGYYVGDYCRSTLTPTIEWTDTSPIRFGQYKIEFSEFRFGTWSPSWTKIVTSMGGKSDFSVTYTGPALSWDTLYAFTVTKINFRLGSAGPSDFDYFFTTAVEITNIDYLGSELVRIENNSSTCDVDMENWELTDGYWSYIFSSHTIPAGDYVKVQIGRASCRERV